MNTCMFLHTGATVNMMERPPGQVFTLEEIEKVNNHDSKFYIELDLKHHSSLSTHHI